MKLPRPTAITFSPDRSTFSLTFRIDDPDAPRLLGRALAMHADPPQTVPITARTDTTAN